MALAIFMVNLAEKYQTVIDLYQSADHPALSPKSGGSPWRIYLADSGPPRGKPARFTCQEVGGWLGEGWLGGLAWLKAPLPHKGILPVLTILLCSLKLHDIWVMLLM